jgi:hypothetical protein
MSDARAEERVSLLIRIPAKLKAKIAELAQKQRRSVNKQIEYLLDRAVSEEAGGDVGTSSKRTKHE